MSVSPTQHTFQASGARIVYFEWGASDAPPVLLIHATGFHARCWDKVVDALPSGFRVIAVDVRGHGRSEKTGPMGDWAVPAQDIAELARHLGLRDAIGAGHSMGGHLVVQIAAANPGMFKRLVLIDPVMMAPETYADARFAGLMAQDHPVARRRNSWVSWEQMYEHLKARSPYSLWRAEILADYCKYGLVPASDGHHLELACPPIVEASIYTGAGNKNILHLASKVDLPVAVLRAKARGVEAAAMDFSASPTWEKLASTFKHGRDVHLPQLTHFIPMQEPELTARFIADANATA